jgi:hypothetical protein
MTVTNAVNLHGMAGVKTNSATTFDTGSIRTQMHEAARDNRGSEAFTRFHAEFDEAAVLEPFTHEMHVIELWRQRTDVNANLDNLLAGRNYSQLTDSDIRRAASSAWEYLHTPVFGEAQRNLAEMASFLEQKLHELDNDTNLSIERRDALRRIWQEGFVMATVGTRLVKVDESRYRHGITRQEAEDAINASLGRANNIANSLSAFTTNTDIQNLILQGLEESVTRAILSNVSANYSYIRTQHQNEGVKSYTESQISASNEAASFRREATELFANMRQQWGTMPRNVVGITRELFSHVGLIQ